MKDKKLNLTKSWNKDVRIIRRRVSMNEWVKNLNHDTICFRFWSRSALLTSSFKPASPNKIDGDDDEDKEKKSTHS